MVTTFLSVPQPTSRSVKPPPPRTPLALPALGTTSASSGALIPLASLPPTPPRIPPEFILVIINHAVSILIREERLAAVWTPRLNRFLLNASLVSSEWRPTAQDALIRFGTVTPPTAERFVTAAMRRVKSIFFSKGSGRSYSVGYSDETTTARLRSLRVDDNGGSDAPFPFLKSLLFDTTGTTSIESYHLRVPREYLYRVLVVIAAHPHAKELHLAASTDQPLESSWMAPDAQFWAPFAHLHSLTLPCHFLPKIQREDFLPPTIRNLEILLGSFRRGIEMLWTCADETCWGGRRPGTRRRAIRICLRYIG
ncbi:hypothetical protein RQP46_011048 [Phenoliferia psychrophenolica]